MGLHWGYIRDTLAFHRGYIGDTAQYLYSVNKLLILLRSCVYNLKESSLSNETAKAIVDAHIKNVKEVGNYQISISPQLPCA